MGQMRNEMKSVQDSLLNEMVSRHKHKWPLNPSFMPCPSLCQHKNVFLKAFTLHSILKVCLTQNQMMIYSILNCPFSACFSVLVLHLQLEGEIQSVKRGLHALFFPWWSQVWAEKKKSCQRSRHEEPGCLYQHKVCSSAVLIANPSVIILFISFFQVL